MGAPKPREYPQHLGVRSGCKVGWLLYADRGIAEKAAEVARWNAKIYAGLGYDFGYQSPGNITETKDGKFEVCIP